MERIGPNLFLVIQHLSVVSLSIFSLVVSLFLSSLSSHTHAFEEAHARTPLNMNTHKRKQTQNRRHEQHHDAHHEQHLCINTIQTQRQMLPPPSARSNEHKYIHTYINRRRYIQTRCRFGMHSVNLFSASILPFTSCETFRKSHVVLKCSCVTCS